MLPYLWARKCSLLGKAALHQACLILNSNSDNDKLQLVFISGQGSQNFVLTNLIFNSTQWVLLSSPLET